MILYYAVGGGLGHLVRARAVLHTLGLEANAALLAAGPHARDRRVVGGLPVHVVPPGSAGDRDGYRSWIADTLRQVDPEAIFVDTFPAGLLGELADLRRLTRAPLHYVGRLLRWPAYTAAVPRAGVFEFDRAHLVEPLHADHDAAIQRACADVRVLDLRDPPPPTDPAGAVHARAGAPPLVLPARHWLLVHSGARDEVDQLASYAREVQRIEDDRAPLVVVRPPSGDGNSDGTAAPFADLRIEIDWHPATALFARAARVVTACGFNVMRQLRPFADRHRYLPLPRRYDDQFTRAARHRRFFSGHAADAAP
jgi:hypothetical protein